MTLSAIFSAIAYIIFYLLVHDSGIHPGYAFLAGYVVGLVAQAIRAAADG